MAEDNKKSHKHSHSAFGYKREGRRWGTLLDCGTGYLDFGESRIDDIAAKFELDPDIVGEILQCVVAHLFINRLIAQGGTGYYCLRSRAVPQPPWVEERDEFPLPPEELR